MNPHVKIEPIAPLVQMFRSSNPDGKPEHEYHGEFCLLSCIVLWRINRPPLEKPVTQIVRKAIKILSERARDHAQRRQREAGFLGLRNGTPYKLRQILLPELKERMKLLSVGLDPYQSPESDLKMRYETILDTVVAIDNVLEEVDISILSIWITQKEDQENLPDDLNIEHLTFLSACSAERRIGDLNRALEQFFIVCVVFLDGINFSNPSLATDTSIKFWQGVTVLHSRISNEHIDPTTQWLQKSLLEGDNYYDPAPDSEYDPTIIRVTIRKFVQASFPIMKLCRLYFNKLSRATNSQPLIFAGLSMGMEDERLKLLLMYTSRAETEIKNLTSSITRWPTRHRHAVNTIVDLLRGFMQCSTILENYWDSLLDSNDPFVDQESISDARQWLHSWTASFSSRLATPWRPLVLNTPGRLLPAPDIEMEPVGNSWVAMEE
ncbi:hypothetical protein PSHT_01927 [Puccinia striiformis]|uniref:Uncharacterized protein n=2 Tax=Puccinia striiformis TaxID=27350 RepID=A0A2S4WJ73_9BASI|nr:hypothetical protein PSHT_01927 [Puccinia striiformis]